jgi:hypothetical protein
MPHIYIYKSISREKGGEREGEKERERERERKGGFFSKTLAHMIRNA